MSHQFALMAVPTFAKRDHSAMAPGFLLWQILVSAAGVPTLLDFPQQTRKLGLFKHYSKKGQEHGCRISECNAKPHIKCLWRIALLTWQMHLWNVLKELFLRHIFRICSVILFWCLGHTWCFLSKKKKNNNKEKTGTYQLESTASLKNGSTMWNAQYKGHTVQPRLYSLQNSNCNTAFGTRHS